MATLYIGANTLYQAGSGNVVGATSITLTSFSDIYGNVLTMADFGALGFITCEPDTTNQEFLTFTGVTANANNTYTLTGVKTALAKSPYTQTSGAVRAHVGGSKVVISDSPSFWDTFVNKNNDSTILGKITLTSTQKMIYDVAPTITDDKEVATKEYVDGVAIAGAPDASTSTKGIGKTSVAPASPTNPIFVGDNDGRVPTQSENDALVGTSGTPSSSNKFVTNADTIGTGSVIRKSLLKFGGTGSDGALAITSGTTTIDCSGARLVEKNYTSISITGTGVLAFSNPHANGTIIIIKSQGDVTLTSSATPMIDVSGMGSSGGAGFSIGASASQNGTSADDARGFLFKTTGGGGGTASGGIACVVASVYTTYESFNSMSPYKYIRIMPGSGGGSASANSSGGGSATVGAGGKGGGCLVIECAGAWNFITASGISVAGKNGVNGSGIAATSYAGGSGAGSGGFFMAIYNTLTANSGTINVSGGTGGLTSATGSSGAGGGSGSSPTTIGNAGNTGGNGTKSGADGVSGYSLIIANTDFN